MKWLEYFQQSTNERTPAVWFHDGLKHPLLQGADPPVR